jgi:hypothetical protein
MWSASELQVPWLTPKELCRYVSCHNEISYIILYATQEGGCVPGVHSL